MNKVIGIYGFVLKEYLSTCFANQTTIDPVKLNKERFRTRAVFTACAFYLKNNSNDERSGISNATKAWLENSFSRENLFSSVIADSSYVLTELIDENLRNLIEIESIEISSLYEALLGVETINESNETEILNAKNYRNKLGTYYTPTDLARAVTKGTIDAFFKQKFGIDTLSSVKTLKDTWLDEISNIKFADFSCGCGNFLMEILWYFERVSKNIGLSNERSTKLLKSVANNISAFDVDCLALEVAKLNLLLKIGQSELYDEYSEKFVHGNFLLQTDSSVDEKLRLDAFASGFIYHERLATSKSRIKKYDIILGNPPWEKIRFEEKKFYALYSTSISNNHFKASRTNEINETNLDNIYLAKFSKQYYSQIEIAKKDLKKNQFFDLSNNGELNTYALFTDAAIKLKNDGGVVGLVLKSAIVTSQVNQKLFKYLTREKLVLGIYDFINTGKIFAIDSRERFCFLLLGNSKRVEFVVSMNLSNVSEIENQASEIKLSYESLKLLNPFTGMLPNFKMKSEADFLLRVSFQFPFFKNVYDKVRFGRIVHLTNHAEYISRKPADDNIPIYEGKFFNQFDGMFSGFNGVSDDLKYGSKASSIPLEKIKGREAVVFPESRFYIKTEKWLALSKRHSDKYMLAWRSLTSATNTRTCIATLLPFIPASQSVQFLTTNPSDLLYLCGLFNSVVFDFILKKKLSGIDLTQSVINQIPVPHIDQTNEQICFDDRLATIKQHISSYVFYLLKNDVRLHALFESFDLQTSNGASRFELVRKIDLLFMFLYKLDDAELELVLSEFSKQYSEEDLHWFKAELKNLFSNNSIGSSISAATFCPIG